MNTQEIYDLVVSCPDLRTRLMRASVREKVLFGCNRRLLCRHFEDGRYDDLLSYVMAYAAQNAIGQLNSDVDSRFSAWSRELLLLVRGRMSLPLPLWISGGRPSS